MKREQVFWAVASVLVMTGCGPKPPPADPLRSTVMLMKDPNPVPLPNRVEIFSSEKEGDRDRSYAVRPPPKRWLKLETTNEVAIRSLVAAMRENANEVVRPPPTKVVTYHIYFHASDSKLPLYYRLYYATGTNQVSSLTAHSTAGNLCNAEGVKRWFATNGLLALTGDGQVH